MQQPELNLESERQESIQQSVRDIVGKNPLTKSLVWEPELGRYEYAPLANLNPESDRIIGINGAQLPQEEFGGTGAQLRTAGRAALNAATLGVGGFLSSLGMSPEELERIKKEEAYNPKSKFLGAGAAYLSPLVLGNSLLTAPVRLGSIVAGRLGVQSSQLAKWATQGAIDGLAVGFTEGMDRITLDGFNQETIQGLLLSSSFSAVGGAALGGLIGKGLDALNPVTESAKRVLSRAEGKPVIGTFDPLSDMLSASTAQEQIANNKSLLVQLGQRLESLSSIPPSELTTEQAIEKRFLTAFYESLNPEKNADQFTRLIETGELDLGKMYQDSLDVAAATGFYKSESPRNAVIKEFGEELKTALDEGETGRIQSRIYEKEFSNDIVNSQVKVEDTPSIYQEFAAEDSELSLYGKWTRRLASFLSVEGREAAIAERSPLSSNRVVKDAAHSADLNIEPRLIKNLIGALGKARAALSNTTLDAASIWKFLDEASVAVTDAWYSYKDTLAAGVRPPRLASELFQELKSELYAASVDARKFGQTAALRAETHDARAELASATKLLQDRYFGREKDIVKFLSKVNTMKSLGNKSGNIKYSYFMEDVENYLKAAEKAAIVFKKIPGMENWADSMLTLIPKYRENLNRNWRWNTALNAESSLNFQKAMQSVASKEPKNGGIGGPGRVFRISHLMKDIAVGNTAAATIQTMRIGMDELQRLMMGMDLFAPKSAEEFMIKQIDTIRKMQKLGKEMDYKAQKTVNTLGSSWGKTGGLAGITMKALPYSMVQNSSEGKKRVEADYKKTMKALGEFSNPGTAYKYLNSFTNYKYISKDFDGYLTSKVLESLGQAMSSIPESPTAYEGKADIPTSLKADFLDKVTALTDPSAVMDYIANGSITPGMTRDLQANYPEIWKNLTDKSKRYLISHPDLDLKARSRMMGIFGIRTMPMPVNLAPLMPQPQQQPQQSSPQAQAPGDRARQVPGKKIMTSKELLGTFTQTGAP